MSRTKTRKPIEIKIATVVAVSATLHASDLAAIDAALRDITLGEPDYFDGELAILDIGSLAPSDQQINWPALITLFKSYRLHPVSVRNAAPEVHGEILAHGLSLDTAPAMRQIPPEPAIAAVPELVVVTPAVAPSPMAGTMIVDMPVRAGQRIYAQGRDLIVTAAVNNGAEIIADGSIHIYAPLRGRALAGASGDINARIFTVSMEAELVSIAGMYRTFDNGLPKEQAKLPAQIRLSGDRIDVLTMKF